ncbi:MAG: glycosyltransferase family 39 protein [Deltaproteobacteria bacterium]|nr:glycosyltransferase family 39 protein [Deltaproteobacteria bacterium]
MRAAEGLDDMRLSSRTVNSVGATLICVAVIAWVGFEIRKPSLSAVHFGNEDIAGITYSADVLLRGGLPLVDTFEAKAPGSFFLTAIVFKLFGRSVHVLESFGLVWSLIGAIGIFFGGRILFGTASGLVAALIFCGSVAISDALTINYNAWMSTAAIWAAVLFLAGLKRGHWGWFFAAGVALVWAALLKRQGGVTLPLYLGTIAVLPYLRRPSGWAAVPRRPALVAFVGGLATGIAPLVLFYLVRGGFGGAVAFVKHFAFSSSGWRYAAADVDAAGRLSRLEDGIVGLVEFMALPTLLATMAAVAIPWRSNQRLGLRGAFLGGHLILSFVAISLGFRYYRSYYSQMLPAALWLAAHSDGALMPWLRLSSWPRSIGQVLGRLAFLAIVVMACAPAALNDFHILVTIRDGRGRYQEFRADTARIGKLIKSNTSPKDTIWIWGRWAWPVYFYSERLSCTRYFKNLGVVTNNLTNTWRRPTTMTRFNHSGPWRELGRELAACKPAFIVVALNESYAGFTAFEQLLATQYEKVPNFRAHAYALYVHKKHPLKGSHRRATEQVVPSLPQGQTGGRLFEGIRSLGGLKDATPMAPAVRAKSAPRLNAKPAGVAR